MRAHLCAVSPVSEPAAFEEDVAAANRLYLTRLCAPVKSREGEDDIKKEVCCHLSGVIRLWSSQQAFGRGGGRFNREGGIILKVCDRGATFAFSTLSAEMLPEETSCSLLLGSVRVCVCEATSAWLPALALI